MLTIGDQNAFNLLRFFDDLPDPRSSVKHLVAAQLNFPSSAQINFRYLERRMIPSFQVVASESDFDAQ